MLIRQKGSVNPEDTAKCHSSRLSRSPASLSVYNCLPIHLRSVPPCETGDDGNPARGVLFFSTAQDRHLASGWNSLVTSEADLVQIVRLIQRLANR